MRYIKLYEQFRIFETEDIKDIPAPSKQVILDGTSSSGKSAALKGLSADWCVLAVDSFYNLMYEEAGNEDFGNKDKPKISEVYPDCPYKTSRGTEDFEKAARWFMAQEAKYGKISKLGLKDKNGTFGRSEQSKNVIYDDVQGTILESAAKSGLSKPKWILVHAPIDHLILNIERRKETDGRDPKNVFIGAYCFKYEAKSEKGGVDPEKSWTKSSVKELFKNQSWVDEFLNKLGIKEDEKEYWIYTKSMPEGKYDVIVNTRNKSGNQMTIDEVSSEVKKNF
jgi:chloramphenicol 3-O-phosphotransferase